MAGYTEIPLQQQLLRNASPPLGIEEPLLQHPPVPLPAAYSRNVSYDGSIGSHFTQKSYRERGSDAASDTERLIMGSGDAKFQSQEDARRLKTWHLSLLVMIMGARFYIKVAAVIVMIVSLSLVLAAVISFSKALHNRNHPLQPNIPVTDHPCIVFSGIAAMNIVISATFLVISCASSKFRKSTDALNAAFCIVSAVGFATSMGACFFLNKKTVLQNDLWKWACNNHKMGTVNDAIDFNMICHVVDFGWKFGLVQASLELLTFTITILAFIRLKYNNLIRNGFS